MTEERAQIAFAPVRDGKHIAVEFVRHSQRGAERAIGKTFTNAWPDAEEDGWRIRKVKIEVVDD